MKRNQILPVLLIVILSFATSPFYAEGAWWKKGTDLLNTLTQGTPSGEPSSNEIGNAFKEALRIGSEHVTKQLGQPDGFNSDPAIHIPLPEKLNAVKTALGRVGLAGPIENLELKLNRAAEAATPKAKQLFINAISEMTFDDILTIYKGPEDSATQYFRGKMSPLLTQEMNPIVDKSLAQVGAVQSFNTVMDSYSALPFVPKVEANLTDHVVQKAMDGIFYYMAQEEKAIREDPLKQTTALLKKVFGNK